MHISRKYLTYILFLLHTSSTTCGTMATHLLKSLTSLDNVCIGAIGNLERTIKSHFGLTILYYTI